MVALNLLGALIGSPIGRLALVALLCGLAGFVQGFRQGDAGRLALRQQVALETANVQQRANAKAADIAAASEREAAQHEVDMLAKDAELEVANTEIAKLEEKSKCVVSRDTVRALNRSSR